MPIDYDHVMGLKSEDEPFSYSDQGTLLYALGVGLGRDPLNPTELEYVFERDVLRTVPSMAAVLGRVAILKDCGYDYSRVKNTIQNGRTKKRPAAPPLTVDWLFFDHRNQQKC